MTTPPHFLILALAAASLSLPALATPISGSMHLKADVELNNQVDPISSATGSNSDSWNTTPGALTINSGASASLDGTASVGGTGSAAWAADGNSGTVAFRDYGWDVLDDGEAWKVSLNDHASGNDWSYTFLADANGLFSMTYVVTATGDATDLSGWDILWDGTGGDELLVNPTDPAVSGIFQRALVAGQTYTVSLRNDASREGEDLNEEIIGTMNGDFAFTIAAAQGVPEPATVALFGLGLLGMRLARRQPG
jgi:hypothetical protein